MLWSWPRCPEGKRIEQEYAERHGNAESSNRKNKNNMNIGLLNGVAETFRLMQVEAAHLQQTTRKENKYDEYECYRL